MSYWNHRLVKDVESGRLAIHEVYYDDDGVPMAQTTDLQVEGDTITEIRKRLEGMIKCLEEPVLDEQDIIPTLDDRYDSKSLDSLYEQNNLLVLRQPFQLFSF